MEIVFALGSAFFAGATAILAKLSMSKMNSNLATAIRTIFVLLSSMVMVMIVGCYKDISTITLYSVVCLMFSGISTGLSWMCYFRALQLGNVNKVAPIDKSSTVLTMIIAIIIFQESITLTKIISIVLILIGTMLMLEKKDIKIKEEDNKWFIYAIGSALFASLTTIIGKIGVVELNSTLATCIRTFFVLIMAWIIVFQQGTYKDIKKINKRDVLFLILSGISTGLSWLCYYQALKIGETTLVVSIDKLSILVTIFFGYLIFKEKISKKALIGLLFIVVGTLLLVFFNK